MQNHASGCSPDHFLIWKMQVLFNKFLTIFWSQCKMYRFSVSVPAKIYLKLNETNFQTFQVYLNNIYTFIIKRFGKFSRFFWGKKMNLWRIWAISYFRLDLLSYFFQYIASQEIIFKLPKNKPFIFVIIKTELFVFKILLSLLPRISNGRPLNDSFNYYFFKVNKLCSLFEYIHRLNAKCQSDLPMILLSGKLI